MSRVVYFYAQFFFSGGFVAVLPCAFAYYF